LHQGRVREPSFILSVSHRPRLMFVFIPEQRRAIQALAAGEISGPARLGEKPGSLRPPETAGRAMQEWDYGLPSLPTCRVSATEPVVVSTSYRIVYDASRSLIAC
jgi:hypothetical protein